MSFSTGNGKGVESSPNVTPMTDVMLVLLIIFMVVTPALMAGFNATPPTAQNIKDHPEDESTDQVLGIDVDGNYYLNKKPIPYDQIGPRLLEIYSQPDRDSYVLYLKADKSLPYEKALDVMNLAAKNDVRLVAMIGEQKPGTVSTVPGDSKEAPPLPSGGSN
ncbi:MAG TPA: biopolymer transporter ExbD [Gemmatimonadaceae bacterium]|jgi:biopolymer transport protein ExbD|nr:biopolymer transporter ExbD [Gemmatimonadaceae bacterium]